MAVLISAQEPVGARLLELTEEVAQSSVVMEEVVRKHCLEGAVELLSVEAQLPMEMVPVVQ